MVEENTFPQVGFTLLPEEIPEDLKEQINNFLWVNLPSSVTLGDAEIMAAKIHDLIYLSWQKHEDNNG